MTIKLKTRKERRTLVENDQATLFEGPEPGTVSYFFKDAVTFIDPDTMQEQILTIPGKGVLNNRISSSILQGLSTLGIPTFFLDIANMREQVLMDTIDIPFQIIVRNVMRGQRALDLQLGNGDYALPLANPMLDFATQGLKPNFMGADTILSLGWVSEEELDCIRHNALRINDYLFGLFQGIGLQLYDFSLSFGRILNDLGDVDTLCVTSQFTPETCAFHDLLNKVDYPLDNYIKQWLLKSSSSEDHDLKDLGLAYEEVAHRLRLFKA